MLRSAAELLQEMTLGEKIAQLGGPGIAQLGALAFADPADPVASLVKGLPEIAPHGVGHIAMIGMICPDLEALPGFIAQVQEAVLAYSRLPVPALIHFEALSGVVHPGAPTYPTGIGQAATWNPELTARMTAFTRERMRAMGARYALSPVLDLSRDPRWGRVHETYGEDPDLAAAFGVAFVRGLQGDDLREGVAACAKHFVGYSASQAGLNCAGTVLGPRTLREQYARPFEAAIREAGLATVMNSYSEIDGVPVTADPRVLDTLLREELGFTGLLVSDYSSLDHLVSRFAVASTLKDAARLAINAGMDVEFAEFRAYSHLAELVREGTVDESVIDRSALRVLELKERLGLLDHLLGTAVPVSLPAIAPEPEAEHELSRAMAAEAVVLLQNDGVLPLAPQARKVAVIGEFAGQIRVHYGAYSGVANQEMSVCAAEAYLASLESGEPPVSAGLDNAAGLRAVPAPGFPHRFEEMARQLETHAVSVSDALERLLGDGRLIKAPFGGPEGTTADDVAKAVEAAEGVDVAVVVVGERTGWIGEVTGGEQVDRQDLRLPGGQEDLVAAVAATGTPTAVIVVSGRPLLLDRVCRSAGAVVWAPLLGPAAGFTLADVIVGNTAPAGRLPVSFPASAGQIPVFHGSRAGSGYDTPGGEDNYGYVDGPARPLFPFGHGLTYTRFAYGDLEAASAEVWPGGDFDVTVEIRNTGDRDADEVVQLYARDVLASTVRPVRQLLAFARVRVAAGASERVRLTAPVNALALLDPDGRLVVEPGEAALMAGPSSADIRSRTTVAIIGETAEPVTPEGRFLGTVG